MAVLATKGASGCRATSLLPGVIHHCEQLFVLLRSLHDSGENGDETRQCDDAYPCRRLRQKHKAYDSSKKREHD